MKINVATAIPLILVATFTGVLSAYAGWLAWRDWTLYAIAISGLYFFGGFRSFPWKTPIRKAFSIGLFAGQVGALLMFLLIRGN